MIALASEYVRYMPPEVAKCIHGIVKLAIRDWLLIDPSRIWDYCWARYKL